MSAEKAAKLDLASWRAALTGAEMIRSDTLDAFVERFGPSGFDRRAIRPCYGMAEATLAITLDRAGEGPRTRPLPSGAEAGLGLAELVSTGPPLPDTQVRIAAPDCSVRPDGEGGEVEVLDPGRYAALREMDIIVELHDAIRRDISSTICGRFADTHEIRLIAEGEHPPLDLPAWLRSLGAVERFIACQGGGRWGPTPWSFMRVIGRGNVGPSDPSR